MENKTPTNKELKKRRLLFVLPLLVMPFLTLLFWTLGGGSGLTDPAAQKGKAGFNMLLPNPKLKEDSGLDKMSYYELAAADSAKREEQLKKDPNYAIIPVGVDPFGNADLFETATLQGSSHKGGLNTASYRSENELKMYQKLQDLQKAISEPPKTADYGQDVREFQSQKMPYGDAAEMKNLEQLMAAMNAPAEPDPELAQLGGMLENILDIQHPERVQEKLRKNNKEQRKKVFAVSTNSEIESTSLLQPASKASAVPFRNAFYSLGEKDPNDYTQNAMQAAVHETQTLVNGSIVKIRLTDVITLNGVLVPRNTFVYGTASLKGERLEIKIDAVRYQQSIFPVELSVYDLDGIKGIYIPGTVNREVAKASADRSMQSIGLNGVSDSWGAQAAGMGVEAAKTLLSKKVKLIKVTLKAGYQLLLYDEKQKQDN